MDLLCLFQQFPQKFIHITVIPLTLTLTLLQGTPKGPFIALLPLLLLLLLPDLIDCLTLLIERSIDVKHANANATCSRLSSHLPLCFCFCFIFPPVFLCWLWLISQRQQEAS